MRRWLLLAIGALYALSIPWYRGVEDPVEIVFGLPDWVAVAVACYVAVALLNSLAWLVTDVPDRPDDGSGDEP